MTSSNWEYIKDNLKECDYSFLMTFYDAKVELDSFFEDLRDNPKEGERIFKNQSLASNLYYINTKVEIDFSTLKDLKKVLQKSFLKRAGVVSGISIFSIFFSPFIAVGALVSGSWYLFKKYHKWFRECKELIDSYKKYRDVLKNYARQIQDYDVNFIHSKEDKSVTYASILILISKLEEKQRADKLRELKEIYRKNKDQRWELYLALRNFKDSLQEEAALKELDSNFVISSLLDYLSDGNLLDEKIIREIVVHINNLDGEDKQRFYLELATILLRILANQEDLEKFEDLKSKKQFLISKLSVISKETRRYIKIVIDEALSDNQDYIKIKLRESDFLEENYLVSIILLYIQFLNKGTVKRARN